MIHEFNHIVAKLSSLYGELEAQAIVYLLFEDLLGIRKTDIFTKNSDVLSKSDLIKLKYAEADLLQQIPIQHIVGFAYFMDLKIKVNKDVLIPRPETEELIQLVLNDFKDASIRILDIGTGSGCIAISIKNKLPKANVQAIDVSEKALNLAKENAKVNGVDVEFTQIDILNEREWQKFSNQKFDVIISNPPYVTQSDKLQMQKNVLEYEPELALFVPEENPLLFYKSIAEFSKRYLVPKGKIYLEINEGLANETKSLYIDSGFFNVDFLQDMMGKKRMMVIENNDQ
ncbi:MAG: peptide chain release factor N(5)-glutamine methyltransferase [Bacteroidetes bacterium]|nr:peptide chain release factor N(5)-glutamine methyltransferase [Bacteroidota bacterium]MBT3800904.1 peptide chain release factor N(5)-glutamine methyltransferase [Bacteroidota bacterium]MBT5527851.1 peptide chain release factor N(5)-glutamine methyltransferase [Cytophagia bacterium]MBT5990400.1 peptide chain release factor N(5)-glutamine methyltransferase [Bacteroidota bacterium]